MKVLIFLSIALFAFIVFSLARNTGSSFLVFALSSEKVHQLLSQAEPICQRKSDCILEPGDILIRRYLTSRTNMISMIFKMYFTHSAVYLGNGKIVEAMGVEPNKKDEIRVNDLNNSDWTQEPLESWVVFRPKAKATQVNTALEHIARIANDPKYQFGIATLNRSDKVVTCADLIFYQFKDVDIIKDPESPAIITPDYLFWYAANNSDKFTVVGFKNEE